MLLVAENSGSFIRCLGIWEGVGFFCNCAVIFHTKYPRHFRSEVPAPLPLASGIENVRTAREGQPPLPPAAPPHLIYCYSQTKEPEAFMGRETLRPGRRQEMPLVGFEVAQVREAAARGGGRTQRLADCWSSPDSVAPTSLSLTFGSK